MNVDPVEFVKRVVADSATSQRGHFVLAPVSEISDFAVCARMPKYRRTAPQAGR